MSNIDDAAWTNQDNNTKTGSAAAGTVPTGATSLLGLGSLLTDPSIMTDGNTTPELPVVMELMEKHIQGLKNTALRSNLTQILPDVIKLDRSVNSTMDGLLVYREIGKMVAIMPVFLYSQSSGLSQEEETIITTQVGLGMGLNNTLILTVPPVKRIREETLLSIVARTKESESSRKSGATEVQIVAAVVINMDTLVTSGISNAQNASAKERAISEIIFHEWENGIKIQVNKAMIMAKQTLPVPFINKDGSSAKAYGNGHALARCEPLYQSVQQEGACVNFTPSAANMKITLRTNAKDNQNSNAESNQRDIVTAYANVQLASVPFAAFNPSMDPTSFLQMASGMTTDNYAYGYRPFQATIVLDSTKAGVHMCSNDTVASWEMGLWAAMVANNNYAWSEGVRSMGDKSPRGTLADLDARIDTEIALGCPNLAQVRSPENRMTTAKLKDNDFINLWVRRNVNATAAFAVDLCEMNNNAALTNLLMQVSSPDKGAEYKAVMIQNIDAITDKAFSKLVTNASADDKTIWRSSDPILVRSNLLVPVGVYNHNGKLRSLAEIDEMCLSHVYGKDRGPLVSYLQAMYGDGISDEAVRRYRMTMALNAICGGEVSITNFAHRYFVTPKFSQTFAKAMTTLGELQTNGATGVVDSNIRFFAPGLEFASTAVAGAQGGFGGAINPLAGFANLMQFGPNM